MKENEKIVKCLDVLGEAVQDKRLAELSAMEIFGGVILFATLFCKTIVVPDESGKKLMRVIYTMEECVRRCCIDLEIE